MANSIITISGNLTHEPDFGLSKNVGTPQCKLRVASSRRARVKKSQPLPFGETAPEGASVTTDDDGKQWIEEDAWSDVDTLYLDVECWNDLAINVGSSLFRGAPVTVRGYLVTDQWEDKNLTDKDGKPLQRSKIKMRAVEVSFDLSRYQVASAKTAGTTHSPEGMEAPKLQSAEDLLAKKAADYVGEAELATV